MRYLFVAHVDRIFFACFKACELVWMEVESVASAKLHSMDVSTWRSSGSWWQGAYAEVESKIKGEESENALVVPASAKAPERM
jgi:hypothetical protein